MKFLKVKMLAACPEKKRAWPCSGQAQPFG